MEIVKGEINKLDIPINLDTCIDRVHRIGAKKNNFDRPLIVRFTSWRARTVVYRNRPKVGDTRYYVDLTKRRFLLKQKANDKVNGNAKVKFVYADINNNICLMLTTGEKKVFNSEYELDMLLTKI